LEQCRAKPTKTNAFRRSRRLLLVVHVIVSGKNPAGSRFSEEAFIEAVNALGALIVMKQIVSVGTHLRLKNKKKRLRRLIAPPSILATASIKNRPLVLSLTSLFHSSGGSPSLRKIGPRCPALFFPPRNSSFHPSSPRLTAFFRCLVPIVLGHRGKLFVCLIPSGETA